LIARRRALTAGAEDLWRDIHIHPGTKPLVGLTAGRENPKQNSHHNTLH